MTHWEFDLTKKVAVAPSEDPMGYVLTFGKYKGQMLGQVMYTDEGRRYLQWLALQPNTNEEFAQAHANRQERIAACFLVFDEFVKSQQK